MLMEWLFLVSKSFSVDHSSLQSEPGVEEQLSEYPDPCYHSYEDLDEEVSLNAVGGVSLDLLS